MKDRWATGFEVEHVPYQFDRPSRIDMYVLDKAAFASLFVTFFAVFSSLFRGHQTDRFFFFLLGGGLGLAYLGKIFE